MGAEASARLVSELVILCLISTLCLQLGSEFKYQSIAETLPTEEVRALYEIAYQLGLNPEKLSGGSICTERSYEIKCNCNFENNTICHIIEIALIGSGLTGVIPKELANLTHLESLNLQKNQLTGSIPASLGNLSLLHSLDLSDNQLIGPIPASLGNLKFKAKRENYRYDRKLQATRPTAGAAVSCGRKSFTPCHPSGAAGLTLDLSSNQLSGPIPATLGNLAILPADAEIADYLTIYLDLSNNQLIGPIPQSLGNLTLAGSIDLHDNFLNGSIPASLGALTHLYRLDLHNNGISGILPRRLGNLTKLGTFDVASNSITGTLPNKFASLKSLNEFSVAGNYLSGPLPDFIANWTSIWELYLSGNNFLGILPAGIFNLSDLKILAISDVGANSHFQFPPSTHVTTSFRILILRNCSITGQIPSYIGNMSSLRSLDLSFNSLTGRIPDSLKNINLSWMSFTNNMLTGEIPNWIKSAVWSKMDLSYNNFSKPTFATPSSLDLNLFSCCCNSSICLPNTYDWADPTTEEYCPGGKPNYHSLFINCGGGTLNNVDGNIYDQDNETSQFYRSLKGNWARISAGNTVDLDYASNPSKVLKSVRCGLSSEAPLYDRARTSPVSLKYYGFCLRKGKYNVTLHFAEIVDEDNNYRNTTKRVFDVYIQGERKLKDFNIIDKAGGPNTKHTENFRAVNVNDSTLEIHFYSAGKGTLDQGPLISAISVTPEYKLHEQLSPLHIALITVASIIVFVLLLLLFAWMMGWLGTDHLQEIDIGQENPITLKQLKDATGNFSKRNEIGQGGFGTVYKAEVQGKIVAVKKLSSHSEERINQLINEFYTLKSMSQENLVQLLDIYNAKGLHLLVYEYMQNNSLAHALFDSKSKLKLDWEARFNICLGIARGLVYLHEHPRLKMVHRDIKSANILLDGNLKAKISDFGLASLYTEDDQFKFIKVEVPQGYMAPEYVRGVVTAKADVYSFGVVILETVSGRKNAGHTRDSQESEFLLDTACDLQRKGKLVDLVDKTLSNKYDAKQAIIILNLAVMCINISPTLRPTMSEVLSVLVGDKKIEEICSPALKEPIKDINDPHVNEIAEFAVSEYNKKSGKKLKLRSVVKGETQVVAGENYRLVIVVEDNSAAAKYEGVVYERIWEHTRELLSFDSHIAQVDSTVSMEVTSKASTSSNLIKVEDETEHISVSTPLEISK
ncbi:probable LRR receptor-like serine/threonine-protein kinase At1g53430 [Rosa rugosa]|uniref:probable LRR receptor-like serine/threonine-protein kinase At1g53430 n=1 Tax=Rosa rugosa TaxID=74645 RepID=UPI002B403DEF|nr:probable LRR receptor-like serine/threonine-protein kinase At1g53430 [Rosa rugosa]